MTQPVMPNNGLTVCRGLRVRGGVDDRLSHLSQVGRKAAAVWQIGMYLAGRIMGGSVYFPLTALFLGMFSTFANAASLPNAVRATVRPEGASGNVKQLTASPDGRLVVGVDAGGGAVLLDTLGWLTDRWKPCGKVTAVATRANGSLVDIFVGCADGSVYASSWLRGEQLPWGLQADFDTALLSLQEGSPVDSLTIGVDGDLYALVDTQQPAGGSGVGQGTNSGDIAMRVLLANGTAVIDPNYALTGFMRSGFKGAVTYTNVVQGTANYTSLVVAHGGSYFSTINLEAGNLMTSLITGGINVDVADLAPRSGGGAYIADQKNKRIAQYLQSTKFSVTTLMTGLDGPTALLVMPPLDPTLSSTLFIADSQTMKIFDLDANTGVGTAPTPIKTFSLDASLVDLISPISGYLVGGTPDGQFAVMTANPWVSNVSATPHDVASGDKVDVGFTVDVAGSWEVHLDGDGTGSGMLVASGKASAAGDYRAMVTMPAMDVLEDGAHDLLVILDDGLGHVGYGATRLTVDNIPGAVGLGVKNVGYADEALIVSFNELTAPDIDHYSVFVSETAFNAQDFPEGGGPTGTVTAPESRTKQVSSPIKVDATSAKDGVMTFKMSPLRNGTKYYVAVRAYDVTHEGPMSSVVAQTPQNTFSAAALAGETGGPPSACATGRRQGVGFMAWIGFLVVACRRLRLRATYMLPLALVSVLAMPANAATDEDDADKSTDDARSSRPPVDVVGLLGRDQTPVWSSFELGYGSFSFDDKNLQSVYGRHAGLLRLSAGLQLFRVFEARVGIGYLGKKGMAVGASGTVSNQQIRLAWLPLQLEAVGRLHILDEQPIVPYARVGGDFVFWQETALDADAKPVKSSRIVGSKRGWHWAAGGMFLLDIVAKRRASMLEAQTGINDTWIYVEYQRQYFKTTGPALDFSGWSISAGLKLDY